MGRRSRKEEWWGGEVGRERRTRSPGLMMLISLIRYYNEAQRCGVPQ